MLSRGFLHKTHDAGAPFRGPVTKHPPPSACRIKRHMGSTACCKAEGKPRSYFVGDGFDLGHQNTHIDVGIIPDFLKHVDRWKLVRRKIGDFSRGDSLHIDFENFPGAPARKIEGVHQDDLKGFVFTKEEIEENAPNGCSRIDTGRILGNGAVRLEVFNDCRPKPVVAEERVATTKNKALFPGITVIHGQPCFMGDPRV